MVNDSEIFLRAVTDWLTGDARIESAVLFGSSARRHDYEKVAAWADVDLHVISTAPADLERMQWKEVMAGFCLDVARPATGGVRKVTAIFDQGQIDLIILPKTAICDVAAALRSGSYRQSKPIETALNEMATCLHTGFRFLKGQELWGSLYEEVSRLPGVRLSSQELSQLANGFLCDLLWALQKLARGEIVAAQHVLHSKLSESQLRLWRELQFRRQAPLPSFGLGRHVENLASPAEQNLLRIGALPNAPEIGKALQQVYEGVRSFMRELDPEWTVSAPMTELLGGWLRSTPER